MTRDISPACRETSVRDVLIQDTTRPPVLTYGPSSQTGPRAGSLAPSGHAAPERRPIRRPPAA